MSKKASKRKIEDMLTETERNCLRILKETHDMKTTARKMGVSYRRVENILYNVRRKRVLCTYTINRLNALCKGDARMMRWLTPLRRWTPEIE